MIVDLEHVEKNLLTNSIDDRTIAIIDATCPPCGECRTCHAVFINRDGRTRCVQCDDKHRQNALSVSWARCPWGPTLTDQQRYQAYCEWCARIGVDPASFECWLRINGGLNEFWTSIWRTNMGRYA